MWEWIHSTVRTPPATYVVQSVDFLLKSRLNWLCIQNSTFRVAQLWDSKLEPSQKSDEKKDLPSLTVSGCSSRIMQYVTEKLWCSPPLLLLLLLSLSQEMINRQMNSVFKELLSRQPPLQGSGITAPVATAAPAPSSSSSSSSLSTSSSVPQAAPVAKKAGFGLRGRALFRPVDWDWGGDNQEIIDSLSDNDNYPADANCAFGKDLDFFFLFFPIVFGHVYNKWVSAIS